MDSADFDLDRSIAEAWLQFEQRLTEVVASIDETADLIIDAVEDNRGAGYVRFSLLPTSDPRHDGADPMILAEAATNAQLDEEHQLGAQQLQLLEDSGWEAPVAEPGASACFSSVASQEGCDALVQRAIVALRDVYGVQHPVFLAPSQLAEILTDKPIEVPAGFDPDDIQATVPGSSQHLVELVRRELFDLFGHDPIRDADGDFSVRVGSTMVFIRATADNREVLIFSPVVHDVDGRSRAMEILNDLNSESRYVRFELIRDRVFVQMSVLAMPFVPAHLHQAVKTVAEVADGIDESLSTRLGGRTTFET
ncbi:MAG: T3SS (YopN, CesT) and YbjN peptide-binding chaperone 1 [Propionibacteriaceae bacterium]